MSKTGRGEADFTGKSREADRQQKEQLIKDALAQNERKRAEKELHFLSQQFHGRYNLVDLLPVTFRRCSRAAVDILLERIRRKWNKLSMEQQIYVTNFEVELKGGKV